VIAFVMEAGSSSAGTYRIRLAGDGQTTFHFAPALPRAVFEHYVAPPVQIGVATSPSSILSPLSGVCDRKQYTAAGVRASLTVSFENAVARFDNEARFA
jgi:hypothetical protein